MKGKKHKSIEMETWLDFKPYLEPTEADLHYLGACNVVKELIIDTELPPMLKPYLDKNYIDTLSCFLTSYLEDIVSGTNIWHSFIQTHKRLYKKPIPFYDLDIDFELYDEDDEINFEDLCFLIWYFLNSVQDAVFCPPFVGSIFEMAEEVFDFFYDIIDELPVNSQLEPFYQIDENEDDFYVVRQFIDTILFKTYLFYPDALLKLKKKELQIKAEYKKHPNLNIDVNMLLHEGRDTMLHQFHTRLLSLTAKEWAAKILGNNHKLSKPISKISQRIRGHFLYKGQDEHDIFIEHIASGKKFKLTKQSFDNVAPITEIDTIMTLGIVRWKDEWWFSGTFTQQPFNADFILDEKSSLESRMEVDFLDYGSKATRDAQKEQFNAFTDFNKGLQIAFMPSENIQPFVENCFKHYNESLNLSDKEEEKAKQNMRDDGFSPERSKSIYPSELSESSLVFFNPKGGLEIGFEVNSAFPLPNNPFFEVEKSEDAVMFLFWEPSISPELAMFCIKNCKKDIPYLNEGTGKKYLQDIDFLLRFWKTDNYHTKPAITVIGKKKK